MQNTQKASQKPMKYTLKASQKSIQNTLKLKQKINVKYPKKQIKNQFKIP